MTTERVLAAQETADETSVESTTDADDAFRSRLERNLGAGYRLAVVILGSPAEAEDATQDALERAWRSRAALREQDRFEGWFQRIVVNACRDRIRHRRSGPTFLRLDSIFETPRAAPDDPYARAAERDALTSALTHISVDQRVVIAMRYYLDLDIDEIARRLGTRPGTVKSRLHRGLKVLRAAWESQR